MATTTGTATSAYTLRRRAVEITEDIISLVETQLEIAARSALGWDDPRIEAIEADIMVAKAAKARLISQARALEANRQPAA